MSFKVIDSTNGDVVWQSAPGDIQLFVEGTMLTYVTDVDESFRPADPKYEWVMVVNAVRAQSAVYWTSFVFNDIYDVDHEASDVPGMADNAAADHRGARHDSGLVSGLVLGLVLGSGGFELPAWRLSVAASDF